MLLRQSVGWLQQILSMSIGKVSTGQVRFSHPQSTLVTLYQMVKLPVTPKLSKERIWRQSGVCFKDGSPNFPQHETASIHCHTLPPFVEVIVQRSSQLQVPRCCAKQAHYRLTRGLHFLPALHSSYDVVACLICRTYLSKL